MYVSHRLYEDRHRHAFSCLGYQKSLPTTYAFDSELKCMYGVGHSLSLSKGSAVQCLTLNNTLQS